MARSLRVAAVGDLHCTRASEGAFQPIFARVAESADVLVLCGDLTDYGLNQQPCRSSSPRADAPPKKAMRNLEEGTEIFVKYLCAMLVLSGDSCRGAALFSYFVILDLATHSSEIDRSHHYFFTLRANRRQSPACWAFP